jgi:hypothetical protein
MRVAVWDTYVTRKDGKVMHFDIILPEEKSNEATVYRYGLEYLIARGQAGQELGSNECKLCHFERLKPHQEESILQKGYYIYEMENCH